LPSNWLAALPRGATLLTLGDWQRACEGMVVDGQPFDAKAILLPWLATLENGPDAARNAAAATLEGRTRRIWDAATRAAPAHAIELTLQNIRLPAETDAGDSVVWGPAAHLASSPRTRVRLLGLTSRSWPRRGGEDPILPDHLVPARDLDPDPVPEADRRNCGDQCVGGRGAGALAQPAQPARKPRWTEPVATTRPRGAHPVTGPNSRACVQRSGQAHGPSGGIRKRAIHCIPITVLAQLAQRKLHRA
jgi:hypothetical protein